MNRLLCVLSLAVAVGSAGCGGSGATGGQPVFPASGTVTLFGGPLAGATIAFAPTAAGQPTAIGRTDATGKFTLTTYEFEDGAAEGNYKVVVSKSIPQAASGGGSSAGGDAGHDSDYATANSHDAQGGTGSDASAVGMVPPEYASSSTTTLTAEVKSSGENKFAFDIQ